MTCGGSGRVLAFVVLVAVGGAVAAGLLVVGSPEVARLERLDSRRVSDLHGIIEAIDTYWAQHAELPSDLEGLAEQSYFEPDNDPETGSPYGYSIVARDRYELCATFATERRTRQDYVDWQARRSTRIRGHGAGSQCFRFAPVSPASEPTRSPGPPR